jgi:type VI secretion system secreted protein Hcp
MALFDAFLKLDGIKGESTDDKHKGEIDVLSYNWGVSQTVSGSAVGTGAGMGAGKAHFQSFTIRKKVDASSPLLMLNCANGAVLAANAFCVRKAGGEQLEYLKIKLTNVMVSSVKGHANEAWADGGEAAIDEIPTEEISFVFQKLEQSYQPQGPDGKALGGPILAGWDLSANKKV